MPPGHKIRITHASTLQSNAKRWQITLECGHTAIVTATTKPRHAHCRTCAKDPTRRAL